MTPSEPGELRIRNQRFRPYWEILQGMLVATMLIATIGLFFAGPIHKLALYLIVAGYFSLGAFIGFALWLGAVARKHYGGHARGESRVPFNWLLPKLSAVRAVKLGEGIAIETSALDFRFTSRAASRIRFAPDPSEDYADSDQPIHLCEATIEIGVGKQFRLIVSESDAQRLRQWAAAEGIIVNDCDGYQPPATEVAAGA